MVKVIVLVLMVAGFCVAASAEVSNRAVTRTRGGVVRRQSVPCSIPVNYPSDCANAFAALDTGALSVFDPDEFDSFSKIFCQPRCGDPLIEYYAQCLEDLGDYLATFFADICSQNENGVRCYDSQVVLALNDSVSALSCSEIEAGVNATGCCFNLLDTGGLVNITGLYEDLCDGLDVPDQCGGSTIGDGLDIPDQCGDGLDIPDQCGGSTIGNSDAAGVFAMSAVTFGVTMLTALLL